VLYKQHLFLPNQVNEAVQPIEHNSALDAQHFKVDGINVVKNHTLYLVGNIRAT